MPSLPLAGVFRRWTRAALKPLPKPATRDRVHDEAHETRVTVTHHSHRVSAEIAAAASAVDAAAVGTRAALDAQTTVVLSAVRGQADAILNSIRVQADSVLSLVLAQAEAARTQSLAHADAIRAAVQALSGIAESQAGSAEAANAMRAELADQFRNVLIRLEGGKLYDVLWDHRSAVEHDLHRTRRLVEEHFESFARTYAQTTAGVNETLGVVRGIVDHIADWDLNRWKVSELEGLLRFVRRDLYLRSIAEGRLSVPVLDTTHPLAFHSDDYKHPRGAKHDNSICARFNARLYQLLGRRTGVALLDLGCAGGGLVRSVIDDGNLAVGLEGSDYPLVNQTGEWATITHHLHTCDVTKPFALRTPEGGPVRFDAVTAWEVLEHIADDELPQFTANILAHLALGGVFLCSVSTVPDTDAGTGAVYHRTVQPRDWWVSRLAALGLEAFDQTAIGPDDWLRGSGNARIDENINRDGTGFHLALRARSAP